MIPAQAEKFIENIREYAIDACVVAENYSEGVQNYIQVVIYESFYDAAVESSRISGE